VEKSLSVKPASSIFKSRKFLIVLIVVLLGVISGIVLVFIINSDNKKLDLSEKSHITSTMKVLPGESIDNAGCKGTGPVSFGASPMDTKDISMILPLGDVVGAHVTPIDHMYFYPKVFHSPRDTYEVRAMADGIITSISARTQQVSDKDNGAPKLAEYQLKFWYTCDFASYYDLVTSLSPRLQAEFEAHNNGGPSAVVNIPVTEGEVVAKIGGQTLDFAVYDYTKILPGFIVPEHYLTESWKLHVVDPFQYFKEPMRSELLALNPRQVAPREGKIDLDIDGKLVGTWFKEGNNGFGSTSGQNPTPWRGHLSFVYDAIDPSGVIISIGDYAGESKQFAVKNNTPDPATIDVHSGVVKYELTQIDHYLTSTGEPWDRLSVHSDVKLRTSPYVQGIALVELIDQRRIKVEAFPGKTSKEVTSFDQNAIIYER
jgi:hypothetical protein